MTLLELALVIGATARLTRLAQTDTILDYARKPLLARAHRSGSKVWELLWCPWCLSFWTGIGVAGTWWWWGDERAWVAAAAVLTASHATGVLAELGDR